MATQLCLLLSPDPSCPAAAGGACPFIESSTLQGTAHWEGCPFKRTQKTVAMDNGSSGRIAPSREGSFRSPYRSFLTTEPDEGAIDHHLKFPAVVDESEVSGECKYRRSEHHNLQHSPRLESYRRPASHE